MRITYNGRWYEVGSDGQILGELGPPEAIVCRRVADFPGGRAGAAFGITKCDECAAPIAYQLASPFPATVPKICMQCSGMTPGPVDVRGL